MRAAGSIIALVTLPVLCACGTSGEPPQQASTGPAGQAPTQAVAQAPAGPAGQVPAVAPPPARDESAAADDEPGGSEDDRPPARASAIPDAVRDYAAVLARFEKGGSGLTLESVFQSGREAARALVESGDGGSVLEKLSEEDFKSAEAMMAEFDLNREEVLFVEPNLSMFLALARRRGEAADVAFFTAYTKSMEGVWPVYIEQQTDYSGCTKYGGRELTDAYTRWTGYGARYPGRYESEVEKFVAAVRDALAVDTCACGTKESVIEELKAFLEAAPHDPITGDVADRLKALATGDAGIRFHCISG